MFSKKFPTISYGFVSVCRNIMADGELSAEELWDLANWLNNHPEASKVWPGNAFVEPLQRVFADGEVNTDELGEIAQLLVKTEQEWYAAIAGPIVTDRNDDSDQTEASAIPVKVIIQPVVYARNLQSSCGSDFYVCDLYSQRCTCMDWRTRRSKCPANSPGRFCKHLVRLLVDAHRSGLVALEGPMVQICLLGFGLAQQSEWSLYRLQKRLVYVAFDGGEWTNIYTTKSGNYWRFGYSIAQDRWAYGERPAKSREIVAIINHAANSGGL